MVCIQLFCLTLKLLEVRAKEVENRVPNPKIRAAVTEADKSKLLLEEDLSDKPWIFQPKS